MITLIRLCEHFLLFGLLPNCCTDLLQICVDVPWVDPYQLFCAIPIFMELLVILKKKKLPTLKKSIQPLTHHHTHGPQTYVRGPWLIVLENLGYSFNVQAWLPLCVAMSQHCEEPWCSFQTLEGRLLIGYHVALFNELTFRFSSHD